jgi:hypothetical protein
MTKLICAVAALAAVACGGSSTPAGPQTVFNATLNGSNETPATQSTATGTAQFTLDGGTVSWTMSSTPLTGNLSAAHIHLDSNPGNPGPVIVTLTSSTVHNLVQAADKSTSGSGSFTKPDATAKNADGGVMSFDDLITAMRAGQTYVNIHDTPNYPGGEIRGQLK